MNRQQKSWLSAALLLISLLPCLAFAHKAYDRIVVFGDSLSDTGNAFYLLGTALTPPYATLDALLIPDAPYAVGGHRFSNGPTWIDQFARSLDLKASVGPAFANGTKGHKRRTNYAVGSARSRDTGTGIDMTDQINLYLSHGTDPDSGRTLYVIEFGGNDVRDAIAALALDPSGTASAEILAAALTSISDNIISLYAGGAREFLIGNSADLSLTPSIRILDVISPGTAMAAAIVSARFNAGLDGLIGLLETQLPGISMTTLDIYGLLHALAADPGRYHLTNVTDACVMPNVPPYSCRMARHYLFWDGIHPTTTVHGIVAEFARDALFPQGLSERSEERQACRESPGARAPCRH